MCNATVSPTHDNEVRTQPVYWFDAQLVANGSVEASGSVIARNHDEAKRSAAHMFDWPISRTRAQLARKGTHRIPAVTA